MAHNTASLRSVEPPRQKVDTAEALDRIEDMVAAHVPHPDLSEPLTWSQIRERYPDQFVFLVDITWPDGDYTRELITARVAGVGKTRRESLEQARPRIGGSRCVANRFTGELARSMADFIASLSPPVPV